MADAQRILAAMGAVPAGTRGKTILVGDGEQDPGYYQTSPLVNVLRHLKVQKLKTEEEQKKRQDAITKKVDMYKTLRDAGYDPKSAYDVIQRQQLIPPDLTQKSIKEQQDEVELENSKADLEKTKASIDKTKAETEKVKADIPLAKDLGEARIKKIQAQIEKLKRIKEEDPLKKETAQKQLEKLEADIEFTKARMIAAQKKANADDLLSDALNGQPPAGDGSGDEMVAIISPQGKKAKVPKKNLEAALKLGWKKR